MWTDTIVKLGSIAVKAETLILPLWKSLLTQPAIESTTSTNNSALFIATTIYMINSQNIRIRLSTTCTCCIICVYCLLTKHSIPKLVIGLLIRLKTQVLKPIVIMTQHLIARGKVIRAQPTIETMTIPNAAAMLCTIIVHMIYCKKCKLILATDNTESSIESKNLLTQLFTLLIHIFTAMQTMRTNLSSTSKTFRTLPYLSFPHRSLSTIDILNIKKCSFLIRGLSMIGRISLFQKLGTTYKIVIMTARLTGTARLTFDSSKAIRGFLLSALRTKILKDISTHQHNSLQLLTLVVVLPTI